MPRNTFHRLVDSTASVDSLGEHIDASRLANNQVEGVNTQDDQGNTPLHCLVNQYNDAMRESEQKKCRQKLALLFEAGVCLTKVNHRGDTVMNIARGDMLIDLNRYKPICAAANGELELLKQYHAEGVSLTRKVELAVHVYTCTLIAAAHTGQIEVVKYLLTLPEVTQSRWAVDTAKMCAMNSNNVAIADLFDGRAEQQDAVAAETKSAEHVEAQQDQALIISNKSAIGIYGFTQGNDYAGFTEELKTSVAQYVTNYYSENHPEVINVLGQDPEKIVAIRDTFYNAMLVSFEHMKKFDARFIVAFDRNKQICGFTMGMHYLPGRSAVPKNCFAAAMHDCPEFTQIFMKSMPLLEVYKSPRITNYYNQAAEQEPFKVYYLGMTAYRDSNIGALLAECVANDLFTQREVSPWQMQSTYQALYSVVSADFEHQFVTAVRTQQEGLMVGTYGMEAATNPAYPYIALLYDKENKAAGRLNSWYFSAYAQQNAIGCIGRAEQKNTEVATESTHSARLWQTASGQQRQRPTAEENYSSTLRLRLGATLQY